MKRHSEDTGRDSKRQKLEKKERKHSKQDHRRHSNGGNPSSAAIHDTTLDIPPQEPAPTDSLTLLENILSDFATRPEQLTSVLGSSALDPMRSLLSLLRGRKRSTSLDTYFPATFTPPTPSPTAAPSLLPFSPNPIPTTHFLLPELPPILPGPYTDAPFIHRSVAPTDRVSGLSLAPTPRSPAEAGRELNYERLEFLGDAYLSLIASSLIFTRFPLLHPGQQSTLRSALVSNDTLNRFSRAYGFDTRLQATGVTLSGRGLDAANRHGTAVLRGNKGVNKICADVFEAYVAAAILSDPEHGYSRVAAWLRELWTPILLESQGRHSSRWGETLPRVIRPNTFAGPRVEQHQQQQEAEDEEEQLQRSAEEAAERPRPTYDPLAKATLQKRIAPNHVRLMYREVQPRKHAGGRQAKFGVSLYLTGWGYRDKFLGGGEGMTKVEAGNRAAMEAMNMSRGVVEDCEGKFNAEKEKRREEKEDKFRARIERKKEEEGEVEEGI